MKTKKILAALAASAMSLTMTGLTSFAAGLEEDVEEVTEEEVTEEEVIEDEEPVEEEPDAATFATPQQSISKLPAIHRQFLY